MASSQWLLSDDQIKYEVQTGTRDAAHAQFIYAQCTNNNIYFKNISVGRGCLLSPTHSNSEDEVRVFTQSNNCLLSFSDYQFGFS